MSFLIMGLIVLVLVGLLPVRKRYGNASLMGLPLVTFLVGMLLGWF